MVFELQFIGFPSCFLVQFICWRNQLINLRSFHCVWVSEDHLQVQWFTGKTHSIYQIVGLMATIYYSKRMQSDVRKGTRRKGAEWAGSLAQGSEESFPRGVTQDVSNFLRNELWRHMWEVSKGSWLEMQSPGFLLEAGYIGILCTPIPDSRAGGRCSASTTLYT